MRKLWRICAVLPLLVGSSVISEAQLSPCDSDQPLRVAISLSHPNEGNDFDYARSFAVEDGLKRVLIDQLSDACIIDVGTFDKEENFPALKGSLAVSLAGKVSERNPELSAIAVTINRVDQVWGKGAQIVLAFPVLLESRADVIPSAKLLANLIRNYGKNGGRGGSATSPAKP